ncbi:4566_t:CDS:2 [Ambispora gerdemannii]|uniref:4566_t:CDS:1 n=1 Tax=Ambispora gerdemannii TaxID=144530 RepID=A0A9N9AGU3_9GLOM|nr:4566_t:CDS:2 [Ambispora gerdemannii]
MLGIPRVVFFPPSSFLLAGFNKGILASGSYLLKTKSGSTNFYKSITITSSHVYPHKSSHNIFWTFRCVSRQTQLIDKVSLCLTNSRCFHNTQDYIYTAEDGYIINRVKPQFINNKASTVADIELVKKLSSRKTIERIRKAIQKLTLGILSIATGTTIILVTWKENYRERFTLWCAGAFRSAVTIFFCCLCMLDYKLLHLRYASTGYGSDEYKAARSLVHLRSAYRLLRLCKLNTGVYIKAGQHLASLTYVVPKQYTDVLSVLQDRAPYRAMSEIEKIIKEEFNGQGSKDLFSEFDETPLAAASLAQVHRAITKDGREAAVKVQYPDVARLFHVDVWTMQTMSDLISFLFPEFELNWIVKEFKQNLIAEFDFEAEGRNGELTKQRFAHRSESFVIPEIYHEFSTKRVLTMQFIRGVKINDLNGLKRLGADPAWVRNQLLEVFAEMIFCHGIVHCDPHPGNALVAISPVTKKPQLILLDHGLYRELSDDFRKTYCTLWKALILNDTKALEESAETLGVGEYTNFLPLIFTQRIPESTSLLSEDLSPEDRAIFYKQIKNITLNDLLNFLELLPRDMLLVFRTINLLRGIHKQLGGTSTEVFSLNAEYATRGFWCETREEEQARIHREKEKRRRKRRKAAGQPENNNDNPIEVGPIRRWYLFGGAPTLRRSLGYLQDEIWLSIRFYMADIFIKILRWWYRTSITHSSNHHDATTF